MTGSEETGFGGIPDDSETPDPRPAVRRKSRIYSGLRLFLYVVVVFTVGASAGWYYLGERFTSGDGTEIPIIRADRGPVKVRPIRPGGVNVPDRDKLVYDRMQGSAERSQVEHLLPPPEAPLTPPARPARKPAPGQLEAAAPARDVAEDLAAVAPAAGPVKPAPPGKAARPKGAAAGPVHPGPSASPESAPAVPTEKEVLAAVPPPPAPLPPAPRTAKKAGAARAYRVQLAAVRSLDRARGEWHRLRGKNLDLLGKLTLSVIKADLGPKKGVFYRLRAGPVADEAAARALCAKLVKRKVGCLVVRPGR